MQKTHGRGKIDEPERWLHTNPALTKQRRNRILAFSILSAQRLRELVHYSPESGLFTRRVKSSSRTYPGKPAGSPNTAGYLQLRVDGVRYLAHRLAWLYVHGEWPNQVIDHIDGNPANNRIANLRDVSISVNLQNQRAAQGRTKSGMLGVHIQNNRGKIRYLAQIVLDGKLRHVGSFDTASEAYGAYLTAKRESHHGCTI